MVNVTVDTELLHKVIEAGGHASGEEAAVAALNEYISRLERGGLGGAEQS